MKKLAMMAVLAGVVLMVPFTQANAEEDGVEFGITADFFSKYVWRGQNLTDDYVFQTGASAAWMGFTASIWGSMDLTNYNGNSGDFSEVDYAIDYTTALPDMDAVSLSLGVVYYDFPGTTLKDTTEFYWGFGFDMPLSPSITFYHDLDEAKGTYITAGLSHTIDKIAELSADTPIAMTMDVSVGWADAEYNEYYWGLEEDELNDLKFSVGFPMDISGWSLTPSISYVTIISSDLRKTDAYRPESDYLFTGISLAKSF